MTLQDEIVGRVEGYETGKAKNGQKLQRINLLLLDGQLKQEDRLLPLFILVRVCQTL